ncbi:LysM peptidoglycan-binding domain-containing protein [Georgenia sp. H159]|uniref:LysM peptidoglycan-binding domain-containing protein n=1 Tax=Georgenia sp. H159 TaxID=3076115 RepID=UPI002D7846C2|nr:LysM peptidoglycan-binding domain-containing protein [Georgenia sp. H159]
MSALAIPTPVHPAPARDGGAPARRGHLQLVGPDFVPASPRRSETRVAPRRGRRPAVRLTARGRLVRSVLALTAGVGVAVAGGAWLGGVTADAQSYSGPTERVSVGAGETVWAIAAATAGDGQDVRDVVEDILRINGLASGEVSVGQQLLVPAG